MRPLLFVAGLAFVATVLITNVDAIHCYLSTTSGRKLDDVPCDDFANMPKYRGVIDPSKCFIQVTEKGPVRSCALFEVCDDSVREISLSRGIYCCDEDYCNRDVPSAPPKVVVPSAPPQVRPAPVHCYFNGSPESPDLVDGNCDELAKLPDFQGKIDPSKCVIAVDEEGTTRSCGFFKACDDSVREIAESKGIYCCAEDYCNRDVPPQVVVPSAPPQVVEPSAPPQEVETSAPPQDVAPSDQPGAGSQDSGAVTFTPLVPLLIAVIANAIAALGI